jgi:hypothetical protein
MARPLVDVRFDFVGQPDPDSNAQEALIRLQTYAVRHTVILQPVHEHHSSWRFRGGSRFADAGRPAVWV